MLQCIGILLTLDIIQVTWLFDVTFQLAAADFGSNSLWQTSYLKDNSCMCILHQYHKMNGLKACTAMCRSETKWYCCNLPIKLYFTDALTRWFVIFFFTALRSHYYLWMEGRLKLLSPKSHVNCIHNPSRLLLKKNIMHQSVKLTDTI